MLKTFTENYYLDDSSPDKLVITGWIVELDEELISPSKDLIVRANRIRIKADLLMPGKIVHLFGKVVQVDGKVTIDVSGDPGSPDFQNSSRANDGLTDGADGTDGKKGGDGKNGGSIKILANEIVGKLNLSARGGKGGNGQDGGNGASGRRGREGKSGEPERSKHLANAGSGGKGGNGGDAGASGKGGDGGEIVIQTLVPVTSNQIQTDVSAGSPGSDGVPGKGGPGGQPGAPGSWFKVEDYSSYVGGSGR